MRSGTATKVQTDGRMSRGLRPAIKPTLPYYRGDGRVVLQGCGELSEIDDPKGWWADLIELLDGSRTVPEVTEELARSHPHTSVDDVVSAIGEFDQAGFLIDQAAPSLLGDRALERWKRNLGFFELYSNLGLSQF